MKKWCIPILFFLLTSSLFAQKAKSSLQLNVGYGTKIENVGLGVTYNWVLSKKSEFSPSVVFFPEKDGVSIKEINFDYHRLKKIGEQITWFPIIGFSIAEWGDTSFGLNVGLGARYSLNEKINVGAFYKYAMMTKSASQSVPMLTVGYKF